VTGDTCDSLQKDFSASNCVHCQKPATVDNPLTSFLRGQVEINHQVFLDSGSVTLPRDAADPELRPAGKKRKVVVYTHYMTMSGQR
jgi:hypothetical protein